MTRMRDSKTTNLLALLEFSINSLPQAYGRAFVRRIVLRHPLRLLRGLLAYRQILGADRPEERLLFRDDQNSADGFVKRTAADGERLLVATGFCQKPLRLAGSAHDCPAGRFNHDCLYLSRLELNPRCRAQFHSACTDCAIGVLGHAALKVGASFAVLTSALDIANDILLPALEEQRFTHFLFAMCPYSVEPMSLALLICGMEGYLFHYATGSCTDYGQWLRADGGDKPERTVLSSQTMARMLRLLDAVAACHRSNAGIQPVHYQQVDNVFRCAKAAERLEPKGPAGGAAPRG
jgi:hypothetical protein